MYERLPAFILGFHGCTQKIAEELLSDPFALRISAEPHDWLGEGMYFWENDPSRALDWAQKSSRSKADPYVVGAVIDLGHCLNLMNYEMLGEVKTAHDVLQQSSPSKYAQLKNEGGKDNYKRHKDCAVFDFLHELRSAADLTAYDTVRSVFWEGSDLYEGSGIKEKNHIQICVRNSECIKGFFRPRG